MLRGPSDGRFWLTMAGVANAVLFAIIVAELVRVSSLTVKFTPTRWAAIGVLFAASLTGLFSIYIGAKRFVLERRIRADREPW